RGGGRLGSTRRSSWILRPGEGEHHSLRRGLLRLPRPAALPTFRRADASAGPAEAPGQLPDVQQVIHFLKIFAKRPRSPSGAATTNTTRITPTTSTFSSFNANTHLN